MREAEGLPRLHNTITDWTSGKACNDFWLQKNMA
jgi:hypothetical protein